MPFSTLARTDHPPARLSNRVAETGPAAIVRGECRLAFDPLKARPPMRTNQGPWADPVRRLWQRTGEKLSPSWQEIKRDRFPSPAVSDGHQREPVASANVCF